MSDNAAAYAIVDALAIPIVVITTFNFTITFAIICVQATAVILAVIVAFLHTLVEVIALSARFH
ncbi:hypothetical protein D3C75_1267260 [compost metagenome]